MKLTGFLLTLMLSLAFASGCAQRGPVYDEGYHRGGPPPHAPAHGYRHKHKNYDMRYDDALGVYVLLDLLDHYYDNERFYRYRDGRWQTARELDSDRWRDADRRSVPDRLYRQYSQSEGRPGKGRGRDQGRGRGNN